MEKIPSYIYIVTYSSCGVVVSCTNKQPLLRSNTGYIMYDYTSVGHRVLELNSDLLKIIQHIVKSV